MDLRIVLAFLCWLGVRSVEGIWLNIPAVGTKCVSEEIHNEVVVLASYAVVSDEASNNLPLVSVKVTSPYANVLHQKENATAGQFAFTTKEVGEYLACFSLAGNHDSKGANINLDWKIGIEAKDWDSVAKKEKLEGVGLEMKKLEGLVDEIYWNLLYFKRLEEDMVTVSEKTNARVAWFSFMSLGVCIGASLFQLWYLKRYFHKKKLI